MKADNNRDTVREIAAVDPDHLMVYQAGADPQRVAISQARKKWEALRKLLDTLAWTKIECRDAKGGVLAVIVDADSADAAAAGMHTRSSAAAEVTPDVRFAELLCGVQDRTLTSSERQTKSVVDGCVVLLGQMGQLMQSMQGMFSDLLTFQRMAYLQAPSPSAPAADGTPGPTEMERFLMMLAASKFGVPNIATPKPAAPAPARPAAPTNGAQPKPPAPKPPTSSPPAAAK